MNDEKTFSDDNKENLKGILWMLGVEPTEARTEAFAREYYINHYVYNLVNLFVRLYGEYERLRELERNSVQEVWLPADEG